MPEQDEADDGFIEAVDVSNLQFHSVNTKPMQLKSAAGKCFADDARASLMAVSNLYGWIFVVDPGQSVIRYSETAKFNQYAASAKTTADAAAAAGSMLADMLAMELPAHCLATGIALSGDELTLAVLTQTRKLLLFDVAAMSTAPAEPPYATLQPESGIVRFGWASRSAAPSALVFVTASKSLHLLNIDRSTHAVGEAHVLAPHFVAACWHPTQLCFAAALSDGSLTTVLVLLATPTSLEKPKLKPLARMRKPTKPPMAGSAVALDLAWAHPLRLAAAYDRTVEQAPDDGGDDVPPMEERPIYVIDVEPCMQVRKEAVVVDAVRVFVEHDPERHQALLALSLGVRETLHCCVVVLMVCGARRNGMLPCCATLLRQLCR
jgi:hypothetical protein